MRARPILLAALLAGAALGGCFAARDAPAGPGAAAIVSAFPAPTKIGHVFVIVLENKGYEATFGASPAAPYLGTALPSMGRLLTQYYATGHSSLDNYVAMVSGQAPNPQTQADCLVYTEFREAATLQGQAIGQGCVYPADMKTIGDQLVAKGLAWRLYAEDMAAASPSACRHPPLGDRDPWEGPTSAKDQYATKHVPFVYFHSVIDDDVTCKARVVDLGLLPDDLNDSAATPAFSFIVPNLCNDGHDEPCVGGAPGGYRSIDAWLQVWVPRIVGSAAYQKDGLLVVAFDESDSPEADSSACCNEPAGYDSPMPGLEGPGGGRTGAVLLSRCLAAGTKDETPVNHYGLLRTLEDVFALPYLGYAADANSKRIDLGSCAP